MKKSAPWCGELPCAVLRDGVFEHLERKLEVLARQPPSVATPPEVEIIGMEVIGRLGREFFLLLRGQVDTERLGNLPGDLVLNCENIFHLPVVSLGPEWEICLRIH